MSDDTALGTMQLQQDPSPRGGFPRISRPKRGTTDENTPPAVKFEQSLRSDATPAKMKAAKWGARGQAGATPLTKTPKKAVAKPAMSAPVPAPRRLHTPRMERRSTGGSASSPRASVASVRSSDECSSIDEDEYESASDNVKVIVRVRPASAAEQESGVGFCTSQVNSRTLALSMPHHQDPYKFTFDHVFSESANQHDLFMIAGHPIVENCLAGYNSSIFAYGQTGAGKTFTMQGAISDDLKRGLAPRVFSYIFTRIAEEEDRAGRENLRFACRCSFLEIYNETITDLLNPASTNLAIREDIKRGCYVESLSEESVLNVDDAMALMKRGAENRRIGETKMNHESSRSHSVFTCVLESNTQEESGLNHVRFSRLNLVDLAGSERNKSSGATGEHFREACSINRSLTTLGRVIMELVEAQRDGKRAKHVPYRDSRLTFLLQDSLGGNAKTMIIANVSPTAACAHETLSTLQFASRAKYIRNKAVVNEDTRGDVAMLQREIYRLHRELDLVRNECTEPVVRENAELNAQLAEMQEEAERSRHKLDSIMGEARKNKKEASWAKQKVAELESANKALAQSYERLTEAIQDMADCNAASADVAQRLHADQLALEVSKRRELASQLSHEQAEHRQADRMCYELENVREQQQQELEAKDRRLVELAEQHAEQLEAKDSRTAKLQQQHAEQLQVKDEQMAERCQQHKLKVEAAERRAADLCQQHAKELQAKDSRVAELQQQRAEEVDALQQERAGLQGELTSSSEANTSLQAQLDSMAAVLRERDSQLAALQESTSQQAAAQEVAIRSLEQKLARSEDACRTALEDNAQLVQEFENQSAKMARLRSDGDEARAGAEKQRLLLESDNQRIRQDLEDAQQRYKDAHDRCEALETDYRRVRREKLDFEQEAETRDRRQQSQIKDLDLEVSEMKLAARMLKEELDAEIVKATKYKRAFNDIDTLIMWARTPPNSARGHRANTPRVRVSQNSLPSPSESRAETSVSQSFRERRNSDASSFPSMSQNSAMYSATQHSISQQSTVQPSMSQQSTAQHSMSQSSQPSRRQATPPALQIPSPTHEPASSSTE